MKTYVSEMIEEKGFINGVYVPWFSGDWYGRDIGTSIVYDYKDCLFNRNYAEPEAEGKIWMVNRGVHWEVLVKFINRLHKAVKEVNPMFATTVSSGGSDGVLKQCKYCNFDVDYVGADIYSPAGSYADPSEFFCTKPFMLGEYGYTLSNEVTRTDKFQIQNYKNYYKRIKETNTTAAFYWTYGFRNNNYTEEV